jgi:hypothetical protein
MPTYIQYVRKKLKIGFFGRDEDLGWDAPVGLGTNRYLASDFRPRTGDRIYLVSSLKGLSLPALTALVVVNQESPLKPCRIEALKAEKKWTYASGEGSRWFPMLDASETLEKLHATTGMVLGKKKTDKKGRSLTTVQRLQGARSLRCLSAESENVIDAWADRASQAPLFISYRSKDGTKLARTVAAHLARSSIPVWFDEWSISIRLDDLDPKNAERQLLDNIYDQMMKCRAVIQIVTHKFGKSPWTEREKEWADQLPKFKIESESELGELEEQLLDYKV